MGEGGKGSSVFKMMGCGCMLVVILILMLSSFILGAKYGGELVENVSDRASRIMNVVGDTTSDTKQDVKKTANEIKDEVENVYN